VVARAPAREPSRILVTLAQATLGALVVALAAQFSIDLQPVPITLQTLAVMAVSMTFSPRSAFLSMVLYLAVGSLGAPVFANGVSGFGWLAAKTGGYLFAFPFAAYTMAAVVRRHGIGFLRCLLACTVGAFAILAFGTLWLAGFLGFQEAFRYGFQPFLGIELAKAALVAAGFGLGNLVPGRLSHGRLR